MNCVSRDGLYGGLILMSTILAKDLAGCRDGLYIQGRSVRLARDFSELWDYLCVQGRSVRGPNTGGSDTCVHHAR
jgi:hypothetical protein